MAAAGAETRVGAGFDAGAGAGAGAMAGAVPAPLGLKHTSWHCASLFDAFSTC